jgi:DNA-binding transcriptional ArsR family regulator
MKERAGATVLRVANRGRALGEPTRVRILAVLARGEDTVGHIAHTLGAEQSTVSKHLQILFNAGLVERRRLGSAVIYSLVSPHVTECIRLLGEGKIARASSVKVRG